MTPSAQPKSPRLLKKQRDKGVVKGHFIVRNHKGLHTRPCTELVKCAATFTADIFLSHQKNRVNAKSLLGLLMLAAPHGSRISIEAQGVDAQDAVNALIALAETSFHMQY